MAQLRKIVVQIMESAVRQASWNIYMYSNIQCSSNKIGERKGVLFSPTNGNIQNKLVDGPSAAFMKLCFIDRCT